MSIPPDSPWRGCAAAYNEPMSPHEMRGAQALVELVYDYNCRRGARPLADIEYRSSDQDYDRLHHVFRWARQSRAPYEQVFLTGFRATNEHNTSDEIFYNLDHYIHQAGRPLDPNRRVSYAFISTTLSSSWRPTVDPGTTEILYRYEIYAPGGIWIAETLEERYRQEFRRQDEVTFVGAIAPQYIRSAQRFRVNPNAGTSRFPRLDRVDNELIRNGDFRPHPPMCINIWLPVYYCMDEDEDGRRRRVTLNCRTYYPHGARMKRQVSTDSNNAVDWYTSRVADSDTYINAAFRSSRTNEAYIFMNSEYVRLNYAPGTTNDKVINGPLLICDGYPSLANTAFAEWGIDSAFGSHDTNKAFIFSGNICAFIDYAPGTTNDKIIKGPMTITKMFPFFKGTVFQCGIDAAFESSTKYEAYLFKGNQYALINYHTPKLIAIRPITQGFHGLRNTIFERGIDAAFASHRCKEAYLFKGDCYALIDFAPGTTDDKIIGGVKKILPNWPSLRNILPRKNRGIDHNHITTTAPAPHVHDEL